MNKELSKILLITSEFPPGPGGIGNHAFSLAKYVVNCSYNVDVLTDGNYATSSEFSDFDKKLSEGMVVHRIQRQGVKTYVQRFRKLSTLLSLNKYKVIIVSGRFSLWMGALAKIARCKSPIIAVLHGSEVKIKKYWINRLTTWSIGKADFLVPVSEFTHSLLDKKLNKKHYRIIHNGIDINEFKELKSQSVGSNLKLSGSPSILTVGNVTPRKGQHRVIKALPTILKHYPEAHYHIVGLPTCKEELSNLAVQLGVDKHITFHGRLASRSDLAKVYQEADLFMILSENQKDGDVEGFGIVILEANYFGLPAIGAKGCGISDAISQKNGVMVDGDNHEEIVEGIKTILNNKEVFHSGSIDWSLEHDWNFIIRKYTGIIDVLDKN